MKKALREGTLAGPLLTLVLLAFVPPLLADILKAGEPVRVLARYFFPGALAAVLTVGLYGRESFSFDGASQWKGICLCLPVGIFALANLLMGGGLPREGLLTVIAAPIFEELLYRGFLLSALREKLPEKAALVLGAALFGLAHLTNLGSMGTPAALFQVVYTFVIGLILGHAYQRTRAILPTAALHLLIDLTSFK